MRHTQPNSSPWTHIVSFVHKSDPWDYNLESHCMPGSWSISVEKKRQTGMPC